jgi:hypothetical protein
LVLGALFLASVSLCWSSESPISDDQPAQLPPVGSYQLRILSPTLLELTLVTTKKPDRARPEQWNFVDEKETYHLPDPATFEVKAGGKKFTVKEVGFKRRVLYAPLKRRDLRIGNYLYLKLETPLTQNETVEVLNPGNKLWPGSLRFVAKVDPVRWSPVIHVNQTGFMASQAKKAMAGYYLGTLGEMDFEGEGKRENGEGGGTLVFKLIEVGSGKEAFQGTLKPRPDQGFPFYCYQKVLEADFTAFKTPGEYRLEVPGLGVSFPFFIDDAVAGAFARTYALGIYHQRCGMGNELPFTRFTHGPCHTAPAEVPTTAKKFESTNEELAKESGNYKDDPKHTAPQMKNVSASLYPFRNQGPLDVKGGHHDAGDYSKYTVNSASFIHFLVFAADVFPGVAELDNLGLPESGDGKSDILQEAKWEADFLAKMQDADGGFYFLVYPRDRSYELDVLPDHGDPQIVWPKTTSVTAAAVAALAQCASSPTFRKQFPEAAAQYLAKAKKGWSFLEQALTKFGRDGAYQKITHYGNDFRHDDELAWAACEMFLATGDEAYQKKLAEWMDPSDPNIRLWSWWRLYACYGNAVRSYAFAVKAGKAKREQLRPLFLEQCEAEIAAAGEDQLRRAEQCAYGTSFPEETKRARTAGWYFSSDAAFDLAAACQLDYPIHNDPRPRMKEAIISNLNYELGCNPVNVTYLTGLGWKRQREIVHQYAQNDRRILPPSGIPLGNLQGGFGWLEFYQKELGALSFPPDSSQADPYPIYDRWGDSFNLSQEFVIVNQARALGYLAWLMAQTPLKNQPWKSAEAKITGLPPKRPPQAGAKLELTSTGLDLNSARIVWEADGQEPAIGKTFVLPKSNPAWIEAEAQLPDGRRVFAVVNFTAH